MRSTSRRRRFAPLLATAALSTLAAVHCGDDPKSKSSPFGSASSSSGSADAGSSGSAHAGSSGSAHTSSSGDSGASSSSGTPPPQRVARATNLPTRSTGCGKAPPARGDYTDVGNGRGYLQFQPQNYSTAGLGDKGYPVMIALHGCYANVSEFATSFMNFQRDEVVGNEGVVIYAIAQNPQGSCGWAVGQQTDVDYLDSVLARVADQFCIDQSRVLMLGYSWGSYMAHQYTCNRPGTIKAVIGGAGGWTGWAPNTDPALCGQIPTLIYGRVHDPDESVNNSRYARDQRVAINACQNSPAAAGAPFAPPPRSEVVGCVDYPGCVDGLRTTYCEDPADLAQLPGGNAYWNHTIWQPYHRSLWQWFTGLP